MNRVDDWKAFWENTAARSASDFQYDRGRSPRQKEIEQLSTQELLAFIAPNPSDRILDAGCGTGANIVLLHKRVRHLIGTDYSTGAIARCRKRLLCNGITNAELIHANVTNSPLPDASVDKIICLSVLQYLTDKEVRLCLTSFQRILKDRGILVVHVKNIASLYLSTLWLAKKLKRLLGRAVRLEHYRSYKWYARELAAQGFQVLAYNSFNVLMIEFLPQPVLEFFQKCELRHCGRWPLKLPFMRRRGSDLKIKAKIVKQP
jgi:ubiquinone/menaquinone biosynthesis C-methylase UbiE